MASVMFTGKGSETGISTNSIDYALKEFDGLVIEQDAATLMSMLGGTNKYKKVAYSAMEENFRLKNALKDILDKFGKMTHADLTKSQENSYHQARKLMKELEVI